MNLPYQSTKNYISVGRNRRLRFRSTRPFIIQKKKKKTIKNKLKNKWVITQTRENNLHQKKVSYLIVQWMCLAANTHNFRLEKYQILYSTYLNMNNI